ncbi:MAG: SpvB/TcaC N-terminal domain-containing protein, partial [Chloroflexales bacterium]
MHETSGTGHQPTPNGGSAADASAAGGPAALHAPAITLPKGGGTIKGIGEKFAANPVTGTGSMSVPIATSPGRSGFGPQLSLSYDSGSGNGPFGFGWSLSLPLITRKTDKGLPRYIDADESDVFILSGAEDLVPERIRDAVGNWVINDQRRTVDGVPYRIRRYRPRVEGLFARIERWTQNNGDVHWRSISRDNLLTLYGKDKSARIVDPADARRIFSWLICETRDDRGNAVLYEYKPEDGVGVDLTQAHERNRGERDDPRRATNRYLKRIRYGNRASLLDGGLRSPFLNDAQIQGAGWMFEVIFDYGEHAADAPKPDDPGQWAFRADPFSTYRPSFEVRTTRLCQRVLMFHHVPDLPTGEAGYEGLVRSTDFTYSYEQEPASTRNPVYTFLRAVIQSGYKRNDGGGYLKRSLPPVEFAYSLPIVQGRVEDVDAASLENLPIGVDGATYQWTDLHGEGIPGVLTEQAGAWFYKRNLSPISNRSVELAPLESVALMPNLTLADGAQFMDLAGDGLPDLVVLDGPIAGLYEHDGDEGWQPFQPFTARLHRDMRDPNLKLIDLDGDGHADILISEHDVLVWHRSLGEAGFDAAQRVPKPWDEEQGPRIVFADGEQSIYLGDMSGDGLTDIIRIRNGEVCYWPNLGYGRFGAKVTMDHAPHFDNSDQFDHRRIRLADIDGAGTTDIIYLHHDGVRLFFNQSGNSWSAPQTLSIFPQVDDLVSIVPADLLGNGTACLVWSSPLPGNAQRPMRYVNLMGGQKPHLLIATKNNLGAETRVQYAPSTKFYLQDRRDSTPWITKLPFPVHVVERVTLTDTWRKTSFSSTYSYHHGYFDGPEREFRGFGRVEHVDVEEYGTFAAGNASSPYITDDKILYQPPVKTVTWFHTGAFLDHERILGHFKDEYFPRWFERAHPGVVADPLGFQEHSLPEPDLAAIGLSPDEWPEALRACKGTPLRQEIYELDVDALARGEHVPVKLLSAAQHSCHLQRVQPRAGSPHAVFHVSAGEAIRYHYELDLRTDRLVPDPRVAHTLNLRIDEYGNIQQAVTVGYPRWQAASLNDPLIGADAQALIAGVQRELHLAYVETRYTGDWPPAPPAPPDPDNYRLRLPCEVQTSELTGITAVDAGDGHYFVRTRLREFRLSERYQISGTAVTSIAYHALPDRRTPQRRLVEHTRTLFFHDDLINSLPLGALNARALPYESYALALTTELLTTVFGSKLTPDVRAALADQPTSGYLSGADLAVRLGADTAGQHWRCTGVAGFNADAPQHFFLPERYADPFGNVTLLDYDPRDLYIRSSTDALGNRTDVKVFDCRVLAPGQMQDMNGNRTEVRFDVLGMPTALALSGKNGEGDTLAGFDDAALNPEPAALIGFFAADDYDPAQAKLLLGTASARHLYYFGEVIQSGVVVWGQHPACACGIVREHHVSQQPDSPVQSGFEYTDGSGNRLVKKVQAEPRLPNGPLRWVASGKTIMNNKGKPVKQYEPYFSPPATGHRYEEPVEIGVTPIIYYDAVGRVIRSESPDGSYRRVEFSPWHVTSFDASDTASEPGNAWFTRMRTSGIPAERRAAQLAAANAGTPAMTLLDSLGREVIVIAHNRTSGVDAKHLTFSKLDAEGKPLWVQDARGNRVMQYVMPPLPVGAHPFDDPQNLTPQGCAPCYDIAGNLLFQHSMDAGERWMLNDAAGKPLLAWNSRGFRSRAMYDALHRPSEVFVQAAGDTTLAGVPRNAALPPDPEALVEKRVYGERHPDASANLRGRPYRIYDSAGVATSARYDFKGNLLTGSRRFAHDYKA